MLFHVTLTDHKVQKNQSKVTRLRVGEMLAILRHFGGSNTARHPPLWFSLPAVLLKVQRQVSLQYNAFHRLDLLIMAEATFLTGLDHDFSDVLQQNDRALSASDAQTAAQYQARQNEAICRRVAFDTHPVRHFCAIYCFKRTIECCRLLTSVIWSCNPAWQLGHGWHQWH